MYWNYREKIFWELKLCRLQRDCPYFRASTVGDFTIILYVVCIMYISQKVDMNWTSLVQHRPASHLYFYYGIIWSAKK